eukprot:GGOE01005863.1.p1 GENE.GGOE01005863.1~~GGOE01005863.1.p1  ORF type:complete len:657 (-),score=214.82 GGOE01005863.1:173-1981(-)
MEDERRCNVLLARSEAFRTALAAIPRVPLPSQPQPPLLGGKLLEPTMQLEEQTSSGLEAAHHVPSPLFPQIISSSSSSSSSPVSLPAASDAEAISLTVLPKVDAALQAAGLRGDVRTYTASISAAGRLRRPDVAVAVFRALAAQGSVEAVTYSALLHAYALNKQMDKAYALVEQMKAVDITPTLIDWTNMMHGYLLERNFEAVWKVYDGMRTLTALEPDELTYQVLIRACASQGLVEKGCNLFQEMEHVSGLMPTREVFHAMLLLYGSHRGFLREAEDVQLRMEGYGYLPNVSTYALVLHAVAKNGDVRSLKRWLRKMQTACVEPTAHIYNQVLRCYGSALRPHSVYARQQQREGKPLDHEDMVRLTLETYRFMQAQGVQPTASTLNAVLRVYSLLARRDEAVQLWKTEYLRLGLAPNATSFYNYAVLFCNTGEVEAAELLVDEMIRRNLDPQPAMLHAIMDAHLTSPKPDGVDKCFNWMRVLENAGHPMEPSHLHRLKLKMEQSSFKREFAMRMQLLAEEKGEAAVAQLPTPRYGSHDSSARQRVTHGDPWLERMTKFEGEETRPDVEFHRHAWKRSLRAPRHSKYFGIKTRGVGSTQPAL